MTASFGEASPILIHAKRQLALAETAFEANRPRSMEKHLGGLREELGALDAYVNRLENSKRVSAITAELQEVRDAVSDLKERAERRHARLSKMGRPTIWHSVVKLLSSILALLLTVFGLPAIGVAVATVSAAVLRE
jgi:hypothetical protein